MSYIKTTNFAIKDTYLTGNPAKVIKGVEIDTEFENIETNFNSIGSLGTAAAATLTTSATDTTAGRVLKVGDFGLPTVANYLALPKLTSTDATTDLNTITEAGWWNKILGGAPGSRPANFPTGQTGPINYVYLFVLDYNTNQTQIAYSYSSVAGQSAQQWMRHSVSGAWGDWVEEWTTGNLVKTTSATDATAGSMLKVGDFGLGGSPPIFASTIAVPAATGWYYMSSASDMPPGVSFGWLYQLYQSVGTRQQTITNSLADQIWVRWMISGVWGAWTKVATSANSLGQEQTWQDVKTTPGRVAGTTYTNSTGRPIQVAVTSTGTPTANHSFVVAGVTVTSQLSYGASASQISNTTVIVPAGATYSMTLVSGVLNTWTELR